MLKGQINKTAIGAGVFVVLVMSGLTFYTLSQEDLSKAWICPATNVTTIFERTSSTNVTGYYTVNGTQKSAICKPKWIKLESWCLNNNVSCQKFVDSGFPTDDSKILPDVFDENGFTILRDVNVNINKSTVLNINGTIVNITYQPTLRCVCDKATGCKIKECLQ